MRKLQSIALVTSLGLLAVTPVQAKNYTDFSPSGLERKNYQVDTKSLDSGVALKSRKLSAGNAVTITYPQSVTLKKKGCQKFKISYTTYFLEERDTVYVWILNDSNEFVADEIIYETPLQAELNGSGTYKKSGKATVKICRKNWGEDVVTGEYAYAGTKKGKYQIFVGTELWEATSYISFK